MKKTQWELLFKTLGQTASILIALKLKFMTYQALRKYLDEGGCQDDGEEYKEIK